MDLDNNNRNLSGENIAYQLKKKIEIQIIIGEYKSGDKILSTRKFAEKYNIGASTVQKVMTELSKNGVIYKKRGVGYFVKPYVREKLLIQHQKNLQEMVMEICEYAKILDVDISKIIEKQK